jgi:hypothetical protein
MCVLHGSNAAQTSINLQMPASHEPAIITAKECHNVRHIVWATETAERCIVLELLQRLLAPTLLVARGVDDRRVNGVDADVEFP